jgi:hypothetical protein
VLVHPGNFEGTRCGASSSPAGRGVLAVPYDIPHRPVTKRQEALGTRLSPFLSTLYSYYNALLTRVYSVWWCAAFFSPALATGTRKPLTPHQIRRSHAPAHPGCPPPAYLAGKSTAGPA